MAREFIKRVLHRLGLINLETDRLRPPEVVFNGHEDADDLEFLRRRGQFCELLSNAFAHLALVIKERHRIR